MSICIVPSLAKEHYDGLVGSWALSGSPTTKIADRSIYNRWGEPINGPAISEGYGNKIATSFVGASSQYIDVGPDLGLSGVNTNLSITGRFYREALGDHGAFFKIGSVLSGSPYGDGIAIGVGSGAGGGTFSAAGDELLILYEGIRWIYSGLALGTGWYNFAVIIDNSGHLTVYVDTVKVYTASSGSVFSPIGSKGTSLAQIGGYAQGSSNRYFTGTLSDFRVYNKALSYSEVVRDFEHTDPKNDVLYFPSSSGSVTHSANGTIVSTGAAITGTATYNAKHVISGALVGQSSIVSGASNRFRQHDVNGILDGQGAIVAGLAIHNANHISTGALTGLASLISGSANRFRKHDVNGILSGQGAVAVGEAIYNAKHAASGILSGYGSVINGAAARNSPGPVTHSASGTLLGQGSIISATAARVRAFSSSGALVGQQSVISGIAERFRDHSVDGILVGGASSIVGTASRTSGFIPITHDASGALVGQNSIIAGHAIYNAKHSVNGALSGQNSVINGISVHGFPYQIPVGIYTAIDKSKSYTAIDKSRSYTIKRLS